LTIIGLNLNFADRTPTLLVASTGCATTSWTTPSSVQCLYGNSATLQPVGYGTSSLVLLDNLVGTALQIFSFNPPVVTQIALYNFPTTGRFAVTVLGLDFGASDLTATASLSRSPCTTASWTSTSSVVCAPYVAAALDSVINVGVFGLLGTLANAFTFDAPVVFGADPNNYRRTDAIVPYILNAPSTGGTVITVAGQNYGGVDITPTIRLGGPLGSSLCATTSWSSATGVSCAFGPGAGKELVATVLTSTVPGGLIAGSTLPKFTYDSPVTTSSAANLAQKANSFVVVGGLNFAPDDRSPTFVTTSPGGHVTARTVSWSSSTSVTAHLKHGDVATRSSSQQVYMSLTMHAVVGTASGLLTFDAPVVTSQNFVNRPAWRTLPITADPYLLFGQNFGYNDLSSTATMTADSYTSSQYEVFSTSWVSDTSMSTQWRISGAATFEYPAANKAYQITVSALVGTSSAPRFTFDSPIITGVAAVSTFNAPVSGGSAVILIGKNLGGNEDAVQPAGYAPGFSNVARFGDTACLTTSWITGSAVMCAPQPGQGKQQVVMFTAGGVVGTSLTLFSYDGPVLTDVSASNLPTAGGAILTLSGFNLGSMQTGSTVGATILGGNVNAVYVTGTRVTLTSPSITSTNNQGAVTIAATVGTLTRPFSFDGPVITSADPRNGATSGRSLLTISGMSYWASDITATVAVSQTVCRTTSWSSTTSATCSLAAGTGSSLPAAVTIFGSVGTLVSRFSFDSPVVTGAFARNGAATGGAIVTVSGLNFGVSDATLSNSLGSTACGTSSWTSLTSALCVHAAATGVAFASTIQVQSQIGTVTSVFTFDAPVVTSVTGQVNGPPSAGTTITVSGINFGATDMQPTVFVGLTACSSSNFLSFSQSNVLYLSNTAIRCVAPPGTGREVAVTVKQGVQSGTILKVFTYDAPVLTAASVSNGPAKSGVTLTLLGSNFGGPDSSPTALVGQSVCARSVWVTGTRLDCLTPGGFGAQPRLAAVVSRQAGTLSVQFTYDAPIVTHSPVVNGPTAVASAVLLLGLNLGNEDGSPTVKLGGTLCLSVSWVADSSVTCYNRIGTGASKQVYFELGTQPRTTPAVFTFDAPVITAMSTFNGPSIGSINTITLFGQNFGFGVAGSLSASLGTTTCAATFVSTGVVTCIVPGGSGQNLRVAATVDSLVSASTTVASFTYDPPRLTGVSPSNVPYVLPARISVLGVNFNSDVQIQVGSTVCLSLTWTSANQVSCSPARPAALLNAPLDVQVKTLSGSSTIPRLLSYNRPTEVARSPAGTQAGQALTLTSTDTVVFQIQNSTTYDQYSVAGVTLAGSLKLYLGQYRPGRSQLFPVFTLQGAGAFQGDFSSMAVADVDGATVTYANKLNGLLISLPGCDSLAPTCNGHGTCDTPSGQCACNQGYGGSYCDTACFYNMATAQFDCTCPSVFIQSQPGSVSSADSYTPSPTP